MRTLDCALKSPKCLGYMPFPGHADTPKHEGCSGVRPRWLEVPTRGPSMPPAPGSPWVSSPCQVGPKSGQPDPPTWATQVTLILVTHSAQSNPPTVGHNFRFWAANTTQETSDIGIEPPTAASENYEDTSCQVRK
uniref:Uncharacterized protein n=1 Tax=Oryza punctata TaxID=4537 RepID=A0A0E0JJM8_ORYPU